MMLSGSFRHPPIRFSWKLSLGSIHIFEIAQRSAYNSFSTTAKMEEGAGETEPPTITPTMIGASQKHEILLNIAGVTLGHSQANDGEMEKLLREGIDASMAQGRTVHGEIVAKLMEGMDANRNEAQATRDEIAKLNSQLELQNIKLDFQTKMQNLAFAFQNAEANTFDYYPEKPGRQLVRPILLSFRRGGYYSIPSKHGTLGHDLTGNERRKSEQAFRDKLSEQIHELTGAKPRFEFKKEEDSYWIYYS
jgi:hypothetical protein